jgi:hypothetical protein
METNKTTLYSIIIFIVAVIIAIFVFSPKNNVPSSGKYDAFAQCLAEQKATMYGAVWCSHCKDQKDAFEGSFKYVPYVECPDNIQKCINLGIEGYPTWIFSNGEKLSGKQSLQKLADTAGCSLDGKILNPIGTTTPASIQATSSKPSLQ